MTNMKYLIFALVLLLAACQVQPDAQPTAPTSGDVAQPDNSPVTPPASDVPIAPGNTQNDAEVAAPITSPGTEIPAEEAVDTPVSEEDNPSGDAADKPAQMLQVTPYDLEKHGTPDDCWLVIGIDVYDVTDFVSEHPGGDAILEGCGKDATALFNSKHGEKAKALLPAYKIGEFQDME